MKLFKRLIAILKQSALFLYTSPNLYTLLLLSERRKRRQYSSNPFFSKCPYYSVYSQSDEDSILDFIFSQLSITNGSFIEIGIGDGTQNNTLNLAAQGWKGAWFGAEDLITKPPSTTSFSKTWITLDNCTEIVSAALNQIDKHQSNQGKFSCDLISIDIDGNDYHIWNELLKHNVLPKVIVAEFNGTFGPLTKWVMPYDPNNNWKSRQDNFFGASFASFCELFMANNYTPICCNTDTGANLFCIHNSLLNKLDCMREVDLQLIYEPPFYLLHS